MTLTSTQGEPQATRTHRSSSAVGSLVMILCLALLVGQAPVARSTAYAAPGPQPMPVEGSWPLAGLPTVVRGFDPPDQRWNAGHRGVDLAGRPAQPVLSAADGVVSFAGRVAGVPVVTVRHGSLRTTYTPVTTSVSVGTKVSLGQPIGTLAAGHCAQHEACLHWGLLRGEEYLDPLSIIADPLATALESATSLRMLAGEAVQRVKARAAARAVAEVLAAAEALSSTTGSGERKPMGRSGWLLPTTGPITSPFGMRLHPIRKVRSLHDGTDIAAACGTALVAPAAGSVVVRDRHPALGLRLVIDHGVVEGKRRQTQLNHAQSYQVSPGQTVAPGQIVGRVGTTGMSTGCHLHLIYRENGRLRDPMSWWGNK